MLIRRFSAGVVLVSILTVGVVAYVRAEGSPEREAGRQHTKLIAEDTTRTDEYQNDTSSVSRRRTSDRLRPDVPTGPHETPVPPPPVDATSSSERQTTPAAIITRGRFTSVQVNVDADGNNVSNDASNEPSIAIDPTDPNKMAIGWRHFDRISSNFRQAGIGYSQDGGQSWTFPDVLDRGQFRSDPVLSFDKEGNFYYSSLSTLTTIEIFKSTNGGETWGVPVPAFGGDKQWMTVDRTSGIGSGNIYQIWNVQFTCCSPADFTWSTNGGASYQGPIAVPQPSMKWGTMDVGPDGTLYLAGSTLAQNDHIIARSSAMQDPETAQTFDFVNTVDLGGVTTTGNNFFGPNPAGLVGQVWVATDHSGGSTHGNVYILGSVRPISNSNDPLDVHFIRSTDRGVTWTAPLRVNDDAPDNQAYNWFGTLSVAPNGRIDVVWYDTRDDAGAINSVLYYTFSVDAGDTWNTSVPVTPEFNHFLGFPQQNKLGDYIHMISDNNGAGLAYAATFNGEQDVYFVRLTPDCNDNGVADELDIANGDSDDCNQNGIPDECDSSADCNTNGVQDICDIAVGTSEDCNGNMVPDECDPDIDCNGNGVQDICDIAAGNSDDCDANDIPDDCELASADCNDNGTLDACDVLSGGSADCNGNLIPDECDLSSGESEDVNQNGVPDECDGACCHCDECSIETVETCATAFGAFAGQGTTCEETFCANRDLCSESAELPSVENIRIPFTNNCAGVEAATFVSCDNGFQTFGADIWYTYHAPCSGTTTISLCEDTNFDAIIAIYGGDCACACPTNNTTLLGCNDDSCGVGGGPPTITIPVSKNGCYLLRVAGWQGAHGSGTIDIATTCSIGGCQSAPAADPDPEGINKSRYLSFRPPTGGDLEIKTALRVTLVDLPPPFEAMEGLQYWVTEPFTAPDAIDPPTTLQAARLGCTPTFRLWAAPNETSVDILNVFGSAIVPDASYVIEALHEACDSQDCVYSPPLTVTTGTWGDAVEPFAGGGGGAQPDFSDIAALVDKFANADGAVGKPQTDLVPREPNLVVDFSDIAAAVDAFTGLAYPFSGPIACP